MRLRLLVYGVVLGAFGWFAYQLYGYLFDRNIPTIEILGVDDDGYYCDEVNCLICGADTYKVARVSAWLDGKPLIKNFVINKAKFEHSLAIDTRLLQDGQHVLKVVGIDGTYHANTGEVEKKFFVDNVPLQAVFVKPESEFKVQQGRTLHLQCQVNKPVESVEVQVQSHKYSCFPEAENSTIYETFIPISCEETPNEYPLRVVIADKVGNQFSLNSKFQVLPATFKKQVLRVDQKQFEKEKELGKRQSDLEEELARLVQQSPGKKLWQGTFYVPIQMTGMATEFGVQRVTQEKGCYRHNAVDLLAMPRSVVWAPQDGVVVVKDRFAESGKTVVIDHGLGVFSLLFHLDDYADIRQGDAVHRGNPIGVMGKTGYASGYHLHWEMRVGNTQVDPLQWTHEWF